MIRLLVLILCLFWALPAWAVTAWPTILFNSSTGSDTAASGAGPATALTGTAASVGATSTSVSITDAVDLSGVATDGSAALWYDDTTSGHKQWSQITAISGSSGAWTVTVAQGYSTTTGPFTWAIGGARQTINGSSILFQQASSANGDIQPGWTAMLQSGYTETIGGFTIRQSGSYTTTGGPITFEGDPAAVTMPIITCSNNGTCINIINGGAILANFELQNSNATKTSSVGISEASSALTVVRNVRIKNSTNYFNEGIVMGGGLIEGSEIAHCNHYGLFDSSLTVSQTVINNFIHDNTSHGIFQDSNTGDNLKVVNNIIYHNGGSGIDDTLSFSTGYINTYIGNTIDSNTSDGLTLNSGTSGAQATAPIVNNIFSNNGGFGIKETFTTQNQVNAYAMLIEGNDFYNNTSGKYSPSILNSVNEQTTNPTYTAAASGNFTVGSNMKNNGYPVGGTQKIGNYSSTYSYIDIGAAQTQCTGGGGGTVGYAAP